MQVFRLCWDRTCSRALAPTKVWIMSWTMPRTLYGLMELVRATGGCLTAPLLVAALAIAAKWASSTGSPTSTKGSRRHFEYECVDNSEGATLCRHPPVSLRQNFDPPLMASQHVRLSLLARFEHTSTDMGLEVKVTADRSRLKSEQVGELVAGRKHIRAVQALASAGRRVGLCKARAHRPGVARRRVSSWPLQPGVRADTAASEWADQSDRAVLLVSRLRGQQRCGQRVSRPIHCRHAAMRARTPLGTTRGTTGVVGNHVVCRRRRQCVARGPRWHLHAPNT